MRLGASSDHLPQAFDGVTIIQQPAAIAQIVGAAEDLRVFQKGDKQRGAVIRTAERSLQIADAAAKKDALAQHHVGSQDLICELVLEEGHAALAWSSIAWARALLSGG